jgi:hypothetical protein
MKKYLFILIWFFSFRNIRFQVGSEFLIDFFHRNYDEECLIFITSSRISRQSFHNSPSESFMIIYKWIIIKFPSRKILGKFYRFSQCFLSMVHSFIELSKGESTENVNFVIVWKVPIHLAERMSINCVTIFCVKICGHHL